MRQTSHPGIAGWLVAIVFAMAFAFTLPRALGPRGSSEPRMESAPVVLAIRRIARLATVEIQVSDVVRYEEVESFLVFDFPKSAVLRLRGKVTGGFDFDTGGLDVVADASRRRVRVRLPPPRILAIDPRFEWFDEHSGIINPITPTDRNRWMLWARASLARTARQAGLDDSAREEARNLVDSAANAFGWKADTSFDAVLPAKPAPPNPPN